MVLIPNKYEGRNYTFSAKMFAAWVNPCTPKPPQVRAGHSKAVEASHSFAVGGDAARLGVCC